jgi:nucleotide-binding universal stress UspA family protein
MTTPEFAARAPHALAVAERPSLRRTAGRPIAAGVGGTGGWQALGWATEQAELTAERLVLLHVCVPGSPLDRTTGDPTQAEVELIDPPLARAVANTRMRLGGHRASLRIRSGEPEACLTDASAGVSLLVVGDGAGGRTVRRVVRHAHCPVVVVRPNTAVADASFAGHVVAGVDGSIASRVALEFAVGYAAQHHLPLTAVHVAAGEPQDAARLLADEVAPWARRHPSVSIRQAVLRGSVADRLILAGARARLLVVGDKRRGVIGRARTGDVPLTVATEAPCPVAVVPLEQHETDPW